jgi:tRNA(Arg) A34 adenosine deaminase TadA
MRWTPQERDEHFMRRAVEIGKRNPACPFGAVLVDIESWEIVAEGLNDSQSNPVRHGEIDAIERCAAARPHIDWSKLWLYTTAEPCCMCQGAVLWAGIPRVIYGTSIETLKIMGWRQIDISAAEVVGRMSDVTCVIIGGMLKDECDVLFRAAR